MPHKKATNNVNNDTDLNNQSLQAPAINPLQNPAYDPTHSSAKIDYSDPSSPPPPLVEEIEEQYANIPKDQQSSQANKILNGAVNWDDPKPNAGDHHAKGLFVLGMSISVVIIVGLAGILVFDSLKKTKNVNSSQKSSNSQASNKSNSFYSSNTSTDSNNSTDATDNSESYDESSSTYSNDGADNTDPATKQNNDNTIPSDESDNSDSGSPDDGTNASESSMAGDTPLNREAEILTPSNPKTKVPKEVIDVDEKYTMI